MKKLLLYSGVVVAGLMVAAYVFLQFFLGSIVKAGVNERGPRLTQTKVELRTANLSPLTGRGTLWGLVVGNPKGWSDRDAFSIGTIHVELAPLSIFGDHIVVHEIIIDSPRFNYETSFLSNNIGDLLKNIQEATHTGGKDSSAPDPNGHAVKLEVKRLVLRNGTVTVGFGPTAVTMPMPEVELRDIGIGEGGVTPGQLALAVMRSVTPSVISVTTHAVLKIVPTLGAAAGETAKKTGEVIKGIFEEKEKK
jgi:hypothetical protein